MASQRRPNALRRRRRVEDEGEDEGSLAGAVDDSNTEPSLPSDDDGDADDSDLSEADAPGSLTADDTTLKSSGAAKTPTAQPESFPSVSSQPQASSSFLVSADTDVMMNGLQMSENADQQEALQFETAEGQEVQEQTGGSQSNNRQQETPAERKRREHEEYKQKRDQDPAFIPNRGAFFMHDHRSAAPGQNGFRPFGRGRGKGKMIGGPFSPANVSPQVPDATNNPWSHDLHDTLLEPEGRHGGRPQQPPTSAPLRSSTSGLGGSQGQAKQSSLQTTAGASRNPAPIRQFSTTKDIATVTMRVLLPQQTDAITYERTLVRQFTKLPDHRPPLRRDKPVRISLPDKAPRYIFPAVDRSFIFIPRAFRPNQQGFGKGRSRLGSLGGFSSRRTSVYGGSVYSPSIPMSRRSSMARDFTNGMASPSGSVRPLVRLPQQHSAGGTPIYPSAISGNGTPIMNAPSLHGYPPPQNPTFRENWPANMMPMHQPRPQKTVSVAGIESPAYNAPQQQEQVPFQHQLPPHVNGGNASEFYPRQQQQQQYPSQTAGTPLSNIPERAIHAPAFQPYQQMPFQQPSNSAGYYYPTAPAQYPSGPVVAPMFIQNGQSTYFVPTIVHAPAPSGSSTAQAGPVAHEQNGMVYYFDPNQVMVPAEGYAQNQNYTMSGMGGMMTPTPDGFYYPHAPNGTIYYP